MNARKLLPQTQSVYFQLGLDRRVSQYGELMVRFLMMTSSFPGSDSCHESKLIGFGGRQLSKRSIVFIGGKTLKPHFFRSLGRIVVPSGVIA